MKDIIEIGIVYLIITIILIIGVLILWIKFG